MQCATTLLKEMILSDKSFKNSVTVPSTPDCRLANVIREVEKANRQGRESRIKVVEQSGSTVRDILAKNYPWEYTACDDLQCFPCSTRGKSSSKKMVSCRRPGVGYWILCLSCKDSGIIAVYHGESGRSMYTRGKEHLEGLRNGTASNCLMIHNNVHHGGSKTNHFVMEATGTFNKPLDRQVDESIRLKFFDRSGILLNSGSEWRGDSIPRASFNAPGLERRKRNV